MGQICKFSCDKCGHTTEVSGRPDCGMTAATETMICGACIDLVDVVVGTALNNKYASQGRPLSCPKCNGSSLEIWDNKASPCPKCGCKLKRGKTTLMWD